MANQPFGRVLHHVREIVEAQQAGTSSDRELLEHFRAHHDEAAGCHAFAAPQRLDLVFWTSGPRKHATGQRYSKKSFDDSQANPG